MAEIPEGAQTASGEGNDLVSAIADAAKNLGIEPEAVEYKLDMAHFRNAATGNPTAKRTVKIVAWEGQEKKPLPTAAAATSGGDRRERRGRKREEAPEGRSGPKAREDGGSPLGEPTEASAVAVAWFQALMEHMGVEGTVTGDGTDERVRLIIEAERAGRIIGKRGSTLRAIRHILGLILAKEHGDLVIDVDVADDRPRSGKGRDEGRSRDDERRGERRRRGRRRDGGEEKGRHSEDKLEALARRAAEKALETGKTITINLELNSYDRRIVHVTVAGIDGVESRSEERDGKKYVQVIPSGD